MAVLLRLVAIEIGHEIFQQGCNQKPLGTELLSVQTAVFADFAPVGHIGPPGFFSFLCLAFNPGRPAHIRPNT